MPFFQVEVKTTDRQIYAVEAENEREAAKNVFLTGQKIHAEAVTKTTVVRMKDDGRDFDDLVKNQRLK